MGSSSSTISESSVRNEISTEIDTCTKNINNVFNETINKSTSSMVSETANTIAVNKSAGNILAGNNLSASGKGSSIDIEQSAKIVSTTAAIIKIVSDTQMLQKLASNIDNSLKQKTENNTSAQQSMDTLNTLKKSDVDGGGIEGMVKSVMGVISSLGKSLTGASDTSISKQMVVNEMKAKFHVETLNSNDIHSKISNATSSFVKNVTNSTCALNIKASNVIKYDNISATDGGLIKLSQKLSLTDMTTCVISAFKTDQIIQDITGITKSDTDTATSNVQKATAGMKSKNEESDTKETKPGLENMIGGIFGSFTNMIIIISVVAVLGGVAFFIWGNPDTINATADAAEQVTDDMAGGSFNWLDNMDTPYR